MTKEELNDYIEKYNKNNKIKATMSFGDFLGDGFRIGIRRGEVCSMYRIENLEFMKLNIKDLDFIVKHLEQDLVGIIGGLIYL